MRKEIYICDICGKQEDHFIHMNEVMGLKDVDGDFIIDLEFCDKCYNEINEHIVNMWKGKNSHE